MEEVEEAVEGDVEDPSITDPNSRRRSRLSTSFTPMEQGGISSQ